MPENGNANVLRNVGVPVPDNTLPIPKEFNFYGRWFESFHFSVNAVHGWFPARAHVCPSSSQFVTSVYFYRLSLEVSFTRTPQTSADNKGMSVCHVYLRTELAVRWINPVRDQWIPVRRVSISFWSFCSPPKLGRVAAYVRSCFCLVVKWNEQNPSQSWQQILWAMWWSGLVTSHLPFETSTFNPHPTNSFLKTDVAAQYSIAVPYLIFFQVGKILPSRPVPKPPTKAPYIPLKRLNTYKTVQ